MKTWNTLAANDSDYDVVYVKVLGDYAWFAALCTASWDPSYKDKWLFVKVLDAGTPGSVGDMVGWDWLSGDDANNAQSRVDNMLDPVNWWDVIGGNLVVHTYE